MAAQRIHLKGPYRYDEAYAGAANILPGMLLIKNSSDQCVIHATEGGRGECMIGLEDALQGSIVSTAYTISNIMPFMICQKGTEFYGLLEDGQNAIIGSELMSTGNGKFKLIGDLESGETLAQVIAHAIEAKDLTGSNTSDTLTKMRAV